MKIPMEPSFSGWLIVKMKEKNWTQSELARVSGLTRQAISYYLSEKSKQPDEFALQKIAKALKIPPEEAFRAAGILPPISTQDKWVRRVEHKLEQITDENDRRTIEGLIDILSPDKKLHSGRRAKSEST